MDALSSRSSSGSTSNGGHSSTTVSTSPSGSTDGTSEKEKSAVSPSSQKVVDFVAKDPALFGSALLDEELGKNRQGPPAQLRATIKNDGSFPLGAGYQIRDSEIPADNKMGKPSAQPLSFEQAILYVADLDDQLSQMQSSASYNTKKDGIDWSGSTFTFGTLGFSSFLYYLAADAAALLGNNLVPFPTRQINDRIQYLSEHLLKLANADYLGGIKNVLTRVVSTKINDIGQHPEKAEEIIGETEEEFERKITLLRGAHTENKAEKEIIRELIEKTERCFDPSRNLFKHEFPLLSKKVVYMVYLSKEEEEMGKQLVTFLEGVIQFVDWPNETHSSYQYLCDTLEETNLNQFFRRYCHFFAKFKRVHRSGVQPGQALAITDAEIFSCLLRLAAYFVMKQKNGTEGENGASPVHTQAAAFLESYNALLTYIKSELVTDTETRIATRDEAVKNRYDASERLNALLPQMDEVKKGSLAVYSPGYAKEQEICNLYKVLHQNVSRIKEIYSELIDYGRSYTNTQFRERFAEVGRCVKALKELDKEGFDKDEVAKIEGVIASQTIYQESIQQSLFRYAGVRLSNNEAYCNLSLKSLHEEAGKIAESTSIQAKLTSLKEGYETLKTGTTESDTFDIELFFLTVICLQENQGQIMNHFPDGQEKTKGRHFADFGRFLNNLIDEFRTNIYGSLRKVKPYLCNSSPYDFCEKQSRASEQALSQAKEKSFDEFIRSDDPLAVQYSQLSKEIKSMRENLARAVNLLYVFKVHPFESVREQFVLNAIEFMKSLDPEVAKGINLREMDYDTSGEGGQNSSDGNLTLGLPEMDPLVEEYVGVDTKINFVS